MFKKKYYYGEGTDNIVELKPAEADAVNKLRIKETDQKGPNGETLFDTNLTDLEMTHYGRAADKLNAYLETHDVYATDEYLENNPILRPIK
jgi:hypothetical protein